MAAANELDESFLPRIHAVFYAVFDPEKGPKVAYQVPEYLIGSRYAPATSSASPSTGRSTISLFDFNDISEFVIPKPQLCNRLVICNTPRHKIAGFPILLEDSKYPRNRFHFNLCFVFDRRADLSCYEPIVRKVARVLMECEEDSSFLSSPETSPRIYTLIEQLFEDLNSYSETSIPITTHTTLDLKIFPFYPNPPPVRDWDVPVALVDIASKLDGSSDLTMFKVVSFIDGARCVGRIAEEADIDLDWVRGCVEHLLYYQHIMLLDIFNPTNIYMLKPSFKYLALDSVVSSECPLYVTPPPGNPLPWLTLLRLYTRLKPGKTVEQWADECGIGDKIVLDVRRFITFGVIKGFLRRIERYPVLLKHHWEPDGGRTPNGRSDRSPTPTPSRRPHSKSTLASQTAAAPPQKSNLTRQLLARPQYSQKVPNSPSVSLLPELSTSPNLSQSPTGSLLLSTISKEPPPELELLLDGSRCGDELCWMFGVSWEDLEAWLAAVGGIAESPTDPVKDPVRGDWGRVRIVYR